MKPTIKQTKKETQFPEPNPVYGQSIYNTSGSYEERLSTMSEYEAHIKFSNFFKNVDCQQIPELSHYNSFLLPRVKSKCSNYVDYLTTFKNSNLSLKNVMSNEFDDTLLKKLEFDLKNIENYKRYLNEY